jgi:HEAT repeat protein
MIKDIRAKIYRVMGVGCLSCSLAGLLTSPGLTQDCARPQIDTYITQFNDRDSTPVNAVSQCGVSAVPSLIEALKHPNDVIRASAVEALGKIGPEAKAAVPSLIQALKDRHEFVRAGAAEALGKIGSDANSAVPHLIQALKDDNGFVRRSAAEALGRMGSDAKGAVPHLIQALKNDNGFVRRSAVEALVRMGSDAKDSVPQLIQIVKNENGFIRVSAIRVLGKIGSDAKAAIPVLIEAFQDNDSQIGSAAASALAQIGSDAIPVLVEALGNPNEDIRVRAVSGLGTISSNAGAVVPALIQTLHDESREVRIETFITLGSIGSSAEDAIPALIQVLIQVLKGQDEELSRGAAFVLEKIGRDAVPFLVEIIKNGREDVRISAISALGYMGSEAESAVPVLIELLNHETPQVRLETIYTLGSIGSSARAAIPPLIQVLKGQDEELRKVATEALGEIGAEAVPAVPALLQRLNDESKEIRVETIRTLGKIGFVDRSVISALIQVFKDEDKDVRQLAATTLGKFGVDAFPALVEAFRSNNEELRSFARVALQNMNRETVPVLIEALKDRDEWVRYTAAYALWQIGYSANTAVPTLIEVLTDKDEDVRAVAVNALGKMGSQAQAAVPALIVALEDENSIVRFNAAYALAQISPTTTEAVPILIEVLKNGNPSTRRTAAITLGKFNSEAQEIVPALITALKDEDKDVRVNAADALGSIGLAAQAAIPDLREALNDTNSDVRSRADSALKKITPESTSAQNPTALDSQLTDPVEVRQIQVKGSTLLSDAEINQIVQPFEGRSITLAELRTITDAITQLYLEQGYVTARALLEDEAITDGIVQIRVLEGRLNLTDALGTQPVRLFQLSSPLSVASEASLFEQLQARAADTGFEQAREQQFEELFGTNLSKRLATAESIGETLADINRQTQTKSAVIYVNFIPAVIASDTSLERPQQQDSDQLELVLITADSQPIRKRVEGATRADVLKVAQAFRSTVTNVHIPPAYLLTAAQKLYQWLVTPLEADLKTQGIDTLVFSPDISLASLPLAALHDSQQFLVEKYSIGLIPSFSLTDTRYVDIKNFQVLAMGASEFTDLNRLPSIPLELSIITNIWSGKFLLNEAFTLQNLKSQGRQKPFRIIHLATHSDFQSGDLSNSYIQLWDTKLQLNQIQQLGWNDPPVELLVLNTNRSGLGNEDAEFGFSGLAVQAGVKSVLSTLWYVDDVGAMGIGTEFYQQLKTAPTKAEALRLAQLAMLKGQARIEDGQLRWSRGARIPLTSELPGWDNQNFSHPYYWAGYILVGSPW